jgi:hypothetical protein
MAVAQRAGAVQPGADYLSVHPSASILDHQSRDWLPAPKLKARAETNPLLGGPNLLEIWEAFVDSF